MSRISCPLKAFLALKAFLVGEQFMELRSAHPAHRVVFAGGVAVLVLVLAMVSTHA